jgi:hypothetical protein
MHLHRGVHNTFTDVENVKALSFHWTSCLLPSIGKKAVPSDEHRPGPFICDMERIESGKKDFNIETDADTRVT